MNSIEAACGFSTLSSSNSAVILGIVVLGNRI